MRASPRLFGRQPCMAAGAGTALIDAVKAGNRAAVRTLLTRTHASTPPKPTA